MKKLLILICAVVMAVSVVGCSKDDNDGDVSSSSSSLKINGKHIGDTMMAVCEERHLQGEYWVSFDTEFYFMNDLVDFEISVPVNSVLQLNKGDELIDLLDVEAFHVLMGNDDSNIGFGGGSPRFDDFEGSVKVKSISGSSVTLQFSNFSFAKESGSDETKYTFNGTVKYKGH